MDLFNIPFYRSYEADLGWVMRKIKELAKKIDDLYNFGLYNYVEKVLTAHPEWTTTVMDGAITKIKINDTFLKEIENGYVTPEQFGAVGDGVTDDTEAFSNMLSSDIKLWFIPKKTYLIKRTLNVDGITICGASSNQSILLFDSSDGLKYENNIILSNIRLRGNGTNTAISYDYRNIKLNNVSISNFRNALAARNDHGVYTGYIHVDNSEFDNISNVLKFETTLITYTSFDGCRFTNCVKLIKALNNDSNSETVSFKECVIENSDDANITTEISNIKTVYNGLISDSYIEGDIILDSELIHGSWAVNHTRIGTRELFQDIPLSEIGYGPIVTYNNSTIRSLRNTAVINTTKRGYTTFNNCVLVRNDGVPMPLTNHEKDNAIKTVLESLVVGHNYHVSFDTLIDGPIINLLPNMPIPQYSGNSVTLDRQNDGSVLLNGTPTGNVYYTIGSITLKPGMYTLHGSPNGGGRYKLDIGPYSDMGGGTVFTIDKEVTYNAHIVVYSGTGYGPYENVHFFPMLEKGPFKHEYVPYSGPGYDAGYNLGYIYQKTL